MNTQNPNLALKENWHYTKTKLTYFISIILIAIFYTSCSKAPIVPTPIPNYDGIYIGDMFQNGPNGFKDFKHEKIHFKVFDNKLHASMGLNYLNSLPSDDKIVRFNLSGSNFIIIPDTTNISYNAIRIITGSGSFINKELSLEWEEKYIYSHGRIDTANFKGKLNR
jgi:hypothetical protein